MILKIIFLSLVIFLLSFNLILSAEINQTQSQELYTENAYGVFYIIIIALLLAITILTIAIILPRIKKYT